VWNRREAGDQAVAGLGKQPRKLQSESYSGPLTITQYQRFQWLREQLEKRLET